MSFIGALEWLALRLTDGRTSLQNDSTKEDQTAAFFLGTVNDSNELLTIDLSISQHIYLIGSSGSGKTTQLLRLIDDDVQSGRTLVVIDLHGDLCPLVLDSIASSGALPSRVLFWDLAGDKHLPCINPLKDDGDVHRRVSGIVAAIKKRSDSWGVQLDQSLRAVLILLAEQGFSLVEVEAVLSNDEFRSHLERHTRDAYARDFVKRFNALSKDQQRIQLMAVSNKLTPYVADPHMRRMLGTGDLGQLRTALDTPGKVILIAMPGFALGEMSGVIGEILIDAVWSTILSRAKIPASKRVPVRLVVDEFQNATCDQFASMVTEGRRFGLSLTLSHQSQAQLPATLRALIRNNSAVRVLLAPGVVDAAELATELAPLSHADAIHEFMSLGVGEAFVVRRGEEAVRVKMPDLESPGASGDVLRSLIGEVQNCSCRSIESIDAELDERALAIAAISEKTRCPQKEVRHVRRPWR